MQNNNTTKNERERRPVLDEDAVRREMASTGKTKEADGHEPSCARSYSEDGRGEKRG